MSGYAIEIRELRRSYTGTRALFGQHRVTQEALRGISFDVGDGELFGLLGRNGAGKAKYCSPVTYAPADGRARR